MNRGLYNIKSVFIVVATLLMLLSATTVSARNPRRQPTKTSLLVDPKMYVGKKSWLYTYRFFPDLDGRLVDSTKIHKPVPFFHHRFSFFAQGGIAGFRNSKTVHFQQKLDGGIGAYYTYFFNPSFGIKTGIDMIHTTSVAKVGTYSDEYTIVDSELDETVYKYSIGGIVEDIMHLQLEVPIMLDFKEKNFDCGVGLKVGVPLHVNYSQEDQEVVQTAYYPDYDVFVDDSWVLGCGTFETVSEKSSFKQTPVFIMFTGDAQYTFPLGDKYSLSVGAYCDFAFLGISAKKTQDRHYTEIETYDTHTLLTVSKSVPVELVTESVLSSRNYKTDQKVVSNVLFINYGLRVSFNLNYGHDKW
ncbi:MAG: hypothetical protein IKV67_01570 [Paludibacteraceae bacterium]|nr:hypothetical protein [Paludibacteraceae bacterium]